MSLSPVNLAYPPKRISMKRKPSFKRASTRLWRGAVAILCAALLIAGNPVAWAQGGAGSPDDQPARIPPDQLDSLVAPIALYPDPLLAQVLAASTYPLEIVQLQQWLEGDGAAAGAGTTTSTASISTAAWAS